MKYLERRDLIDKLRALITDLERDRVERVTFFSHVESPHPIGREPRMLVEIDVVFK